MWVAESKTEAVRFWSVLILFLTGFGGESRVYRGVWGLNVDLLFCCSQFYEILV
jgi:hypothetical protein